MPAPIDPNAANSDTLAAPNGVTNDVAEPPKTPSDLPPAALDLAAKLFDLAREGDTDTLKQYLEAGPSRPSPSTATLKPDLPVPQTLTRAPGVPINLTNHAGDTLLMLAAYHDRASTVSLLLAKGADANAANARGQTPLAGAVFKGHGRVVELLVRGGADVSAGRPCALDAARLFRRDDLLALLSGGVGAPPSEGEPEGADLGLRSEALRREAAGA